MIELSRLRGSKRYAACSSDIIAHPPSGSPRYARGRLLLCCGEKNFLSYTKDKNSQMYTLFTDFFANIFS